MSSPPPLLLTGFEPFDADCVNPSAAVAEALHGQAVAGVRVVGVQLPCTFGGSLAVLGEAIDRHRPVLVLALGQAAARSELSIERVAINVDDARIPDNDGVQPIDQPIVPDGPAAYFSTLPIKAMAAGLRAAGFPASVSQTAGTFVCNHVFYGLQHTLAGRGIRSGFMHLPLLDEQAARHPGAPTWPLAAMVAGVRLGLQLALQHPRDIRAGGGAIA
ncbi:pyroglutamyl-peptidase I [Aquincola sp. MAHUQ-54]|uniref:Pyrrolidone-carboxylate peptidase n=1 Tax=Aquincola agrisoli TaxID=3119538 RepID=A0AAW9QG79_9BURK